MVFIGRSGKGGGADRNYGIVGGLLCKYGGPYDFDSPSNGYDDVERVMHQELL